MHIVIEPHADDAFLSLGGHIERWVKNGEPVHIVTVYSGTRKRGNDARAYAEAVGATWVGLGAKERRGGGNSGDGTEALKQYLRSPAWADVRATLYCCLAVKHPDHVEVRTAIDKHGPVAPALHYYLDQPYATVMRNGERIHDLLYRTSIVSFLQPPRRKYRHIPLFKDQGRFFYFNPAEKLNRCVELIVEIQ